MLSKNLGLHAINLFIGALEMDIELIKRAGGEKVTETELGEKAGPSGTVLPSYNNDISFRPVAPVDIALQRLVVTVEKNVSALEKLRSRLHNKQAVAQEDETKRKTILGDVSANFPQGTLTAIIGGSGSGKTSL